MFANVKSIGALSKFIVGECTICIMPVYQSTDDDLVQNISTCKINENKFAYIILVSDICLNKTKEI